jgi:signal transduction histidine kinase
LVFFAFVWLLSGGVYLWVNNSLGEGYVSRINSTLEQQHSTATHQAEISDSAAAIAADITLDRLRNILLGVNGALLIGVPLVAYRISRRTLLPLVESQKSQQRFVANASHELRTPLAVMLADLDWALAKERTTTDYKNTITSTRREVQDMSTLVQSLLTLTRLDDQNISFMPIDIENLISQVVAGHQPQAAEKHITITTKVRGVTVQGAADLLAIVFSNLLENAVKYAPQDSAIRISGEATTQSATIHISNRADGVTEHDLPHLFDRFYQAAAHQGGRGSGLGLAIVKQIVEAHRGSVGATLDDHMLTFTITLPTS